MSACLFWPPDKPGPAGIVATNASYTQVQGMILVADMPPAKFTRNTSEASAVKLKIPPFPTVVSATLFLNSVGWDETDSKVP